jgi:hypothetical protein
MLTLLWKATWRLGGISIKCFVLFHVTLYKVRHLLKAVVFWWNQLGWYGFHSFEPPSVSRSVVDHGGRFTLILTILPYHFAVLWEWGSSHNPMLWWMLDIQLVDQITFLVSGVFLDKCITNLEIVFLSW